MIVETVPTIKQLLIENRSYSKKMLRYFLIIKKMWK